MGDTLAAAQAASPVVRPIAGLNGHQLRIEGSTANDDSLFVDVDRFVDPLGINFDGTIVFSGKIGVGDQDRLVVFDSDLSTDDSADSVSYASLPVPGSGVMNVNPEGDSPDIIIQYSATEFVDQLIDGNRIDVTMSDHTEALLIDRDPGSPNRNQIQTVVDTNPGTLITIPNPSESLSILGGSGNNTVEFNGISAAFRAPLDVVGSGGSDTIAIATPLTLGRGGITGNIRLHAESIRILDSVSTIGGTTDGDVILTGGDAIVISSGTVSSGNAPILIDGNHGTIDTSGGILRSLNSVIVRDASSAMLGEIVTSNGTLTLGIDRDISGPITQAAGTSIIARRLTASTNGSIDLSNPSNQFQVLDGIISDGAISIADGTGNLQVMGVDSGGNDITLSTLGTAVLETVIQSPGATVRIDAGVAIRDFDPADTTAKITADTVFLTAGSGGIGQSGALEVNADVLSIDTSAGNGNVHVTNPFGGLRIGEVNAGSGVVQLSADQIDDAANDTLTDFTASRLVLEAKTGIGSIGPLELFAVERLSAVTDTGGINLDWTTTGDTVVEKLIAESGGIMLTQRGADSMDIEILENLSGSVNIVSEDGAIDIAAGALISADTIRIAAARELLIDRSIRTTTGPLDLLSAQSVSLSGNLDTTAAGSSGVISVTSPLVQLNNAQLTSEGANITVAGNLVIDGETRVDSGNQQSSIQGGDIEVTGGISGADSVGDRLLIDARGSNLDGDVAIRGPVGATGGVVGARDINALAVHADRITIDSVGVTRGVIELTAAQVQLTGDELRTSVVGDIDINAPLSLPANDVAINAAASVLLRNEVSGVANSTDVVITAGKDAFIDGAIGDLVGFNVDAAETTRLLGSVDVTGDVTLDGQIVELFSPTITTLGTVIFGNDVVFKADSLVSADKARFDATVTVDPLLTTEIAASIIDSPIASELVKLGGGTLVLSAISPFAQNTHVAAGTLRVTGAFGSFPSNLVVADGARLEGDGRTESNVIVEDGGQISPGFPAAVGNEPAALSVGSLRLSDGSLFEVQLDGPNAGSDYDQLVIDATGGAAGTGMLGGAILGFTVGFVPEANTEFIVISNDGSDSIDGRLQTFVGVDGSLLPVARTLEEGDLIFDASIGSAEPAYITYFGGDGNDVAIVTAGDVSIQSQGVTLVSRRGSNLEIRVGDSLAAAQAASPVVRPIAGLNGHELRIEGTAAIDDQLFVDVDQFVRANEINFDGAIVFKGADSAGDQDSLIVFDSDLSTDDSVESVSYRSLAIAGSAVMNLDPAGNFPDIPIQYSGTERVDQLIDAKRIDLTMSNRSETLLIDQDAGSPRQNQIQTFVDAIPGTLLSIPNPAESLSILGGTGDDTVEFNGISSEFRAAVEVVGGGGTDRIVMAAPLTLGSGGVTGNISLSAESMQILESISTTGGLTDGTVTLTGGSEIVIGPATVSSGDAPILIDGDGGTIDTAGATLRSDAIVVRDASSVLLGNIQSPDGTVTLGIDRDITGSVTQAAGTTVVAKTLIASTDGSLDLANASNEFQLLDGIITDGAISISDSSGDLRLIGIDSNRNNITISTLGTAVLETAIQSPGATVQIDAGQAIRDFDPADTTAKITADTVILTAGSGGIGQAGAFEINANVLSIDTSAGDGNVHVTNPFGNLRIQRVNAGTGVVQLSADQIDDAADDTLADFIASRLVLTAETGIGSVRPLELFAVQRLSAETGSGGINLDWTTTGDTVVEKLIAGSGGIELTQRGGQSLDIQILENLSGSVNIVSEDGSIDIAAGPLISADTIRIEAARELSIDRSIRATDGPLALLSDERVALLGSLDTTAAGTFGAITISSPLIQFTDARLTSAGATITVDGNLTIDGQTRVDSGNQQTASQGGNIEFTQGISGADSVGDRLFVDARGSSLDGDVTIRGPIGATGGAVARDINALEVHANVIAIHAVGVTSGDVRLTGSEVILNGDELRTSVSGDIEIKAPLTLPGGDVAIMAADSVWLRDDLTGIASTDVAITAGQNIFIDGAIQGLGDLLIEAGDLTRLIGNVDVTGNARLAGQTIEIFSASIATPGNVVFGNDVAFQADSLVEAAQVRFDAAVTVDPLLTTEIAASMIDSPIASEWVKLGDGTLVLSGISPFAQNARVAAGTLRVTGTFGSGGANLVVAGDARLEGDGRIGANVMVQTDGAVGPGNSQAGGDVDATLITDSLVLLPGSQFEVQINGPRVGIDTDQIVVDPLGPADGIVSVGGSILQASVSFVPLESTEFVIIDNDGIDDVIGRFDSAAEGRIIFGTEGLPGPRALHHLFWGRWQ